MNFLKKLFILKLLILNLFVGAAWSQPRRAPVRRKQPPNVRVTKSVRKAPVAKPVAAATAVPPAPTSAATTTASGLTYIVTQPGDGAQLKAGDTVTVHYTGLLTNGVKFDSSQDRNEPISFQLGAGRVIKGWDEALQKLRVGDRATLVIPPQLAYGERGAGGVIPPDATLIFVVEVVGVK